MGELATSQADSHLVHTPAPLALTRGSRGARVLFENAANP